MLEGFYTIVSDGSTEECRFSFESAGYLHDQRISLQSKEADRVVEIVIPRFSNQQLAELGTLLIALSMYSEIDSDSTYELLSGYGLKQGQLDKIAERMRTIADALTGD